MSNKILGALSAVAVAGGLMFASTAPSAAAGRVGIYVAPAPVNSGCWVWSHRLHRRVWACNEPYAYNPPMFDFGLGFGFGDNHHRHHHHN